MFSGTVNNRTACPSKCVSALPSHAVSPLPVSGRSLAPLLPVKQVARTFSRVLRSPARAEAATAVKSKRGRKAGGTVAKPVLPTVRLLISTSSESSSTVCIVISYLEILNFPALL